MYYVTRRVNIIRKSSNPHEWGYVSTNDNPADIGSRSCIAGEIMASSWFTGPDFLYDPAFVSTDTYNVELPEQVKEPKVLKSEVSEKSVGHQLASNTSSFPKLIESMIILVNIRHKIDLAKQRCGVSLASKVTISQ